MHGADRIFYHMGYRASGVDSLVLDGPVDQDKLTTVARDCILASVECRVRREEKKTSENMLKSLHRFSVKFV